MLFLVLIQGNIVKKEFSIGIVIGISEYVFFLSVLVSVYRRLNDNGIGIGIGYCAHIGINIG